MVENYPAELLSTWEEVFKKGLLSFWILFLLHSRPSYPFEMKNLIEEISNGSISADSNSIYRALSRFEKLGLVESELVYSKRGPDRRYYSVSTAGIYLLGHFIERNLIIFQKKEINAQMQSVLRDCGIEDKL
jgi:PadR family transcriptional regulator PadR